MGMDLESKRVQSFVFLRSSHSSSGGEGSHEGRLCPTLAFEVHGIRCGEIRGGFDEGRHRPRGKIVQRHSSE